MIWQDFLLIPVILASLYWPATTIFMAVFWGREKSILEAKQPRSYLPYISLIKPVCGLEKDLYINLATACQQDYPDYEVIYSVQNRDDPALEILQEIREVYPQRNIQIVVDEDAVGPNGRLSNTYNASKRAKGTILVLSDSDMFLLPDYLKTIVTPLVHEKVGISCTLYKAWKPGNIFETLELLSLNADFVPSMVLAIVTKASLACPGATLAIRREVLDQIGGFPPLGHYLVEDNELGRRVVAAGYQIHFASYVANTSVDLKTLQDWWRHQVYWDQNTKSANPSGFFLTILTRGVPFAFLYALLGGSYGWPVLLGTLGLRIMTAVGNSFYLKDNDGIRNVWLLPVRDLFGIFVWLASFVKKETHWRGKTFILNRGILVEVKGS
jgi:ceramide glucosyltransferase